MQDVVSVGGYIQVGSVYVMWALFSFWKGDVIYGKQIAAHFLRAHIGLEQKINAHRLAGFKPASQHSWPARAVAGPEGPALQAPDGCLQPRSHAEGKYRADKLAGVESENDGFAVFSNLFGDFDFDKTSPHKKAPLLSGARVLIGRLSQQPLVVLPAIHDPVYIYVVVPDLV